jgi:nucleotide-binding universal stress UspA family protein
MASEDAQQERRGRIVVGIDGSEGSKAALRWALDEARLRGAVLEALAVWHLPVMAIASGYAPAFDEEAISGLRAGSEKIVVDALAELRDDAAGVDVRTHVHEGVPAEILVERSAGADLLVVGSRGLGGFSRLLLGSVGDACAHHARCPVVIVRPPAG